MKRYFENEEARAIGDTTQNILMDYLRAQLLLRPEVATMCPDGVLVTQSLATARNRFRAKDNQSFVLIQEAGHDWEFERVRIEDEDGQFLQNARGTRHNWTFEIQLSARNDEAARNGPSNTPKLDRRLCDIVNEIFQIGYLDLLELGVTVTDFGGVKGKAGDASKINPHILTAETLTRDA